MSTASSRHFLGCTGCTETVEVEGVENVKLNVKVSHARNHTTKFKTSHVSRSDAIDDGRCCRTRGWKGQDQLIWMIQDDKPQPEVNKVQSFFFFFFF